MSRVRRASSCPSFWRWLVAVFFWKLVSAVSVAPSTMIISTAAIRTSTSVNPSSEPSCRIRVVMGKR
jgi:hypothetical protein